MEEYMKGLPIHIEKYVGENDLFLEIYGGDKPSTSEIKHPPLLFVHGAYTGSWMWYKFIPHFVREGYLSYAMNMRSHYKSRVMDMSLITFEDYLEDIDLICNEIIDKYGEPPVVIGFSMGGILCQKLAEKLKFAGLVLVDTSISKEVSIRAPYTNLVENTFGLVVPAPIRVDDSSIDESSADIAFQKKYLSMESAKVMTTMSCWLKNSDGISINSSLIKCPCLVIKAVNSREDDRQGQITAEHLNAEYLGLNGTTHTGLLVGQRYAEVVDRILEWLHKF